MNSNSKYYEMLDETDSVRMELLKPESIIKNGKVVNREDLSHDPLRRQLAYAMKAELHIMIYVEMIGEMVSVDTDGKDVDITMQRFLIASSCEWVFTTHLIGQQNLLTVFLNNQAALHV